jgi:hypothetical protein
LNGSPSSHVDQLAANKATLLDQIHHGQQLLPILGKELAQLPGVDLPLLVDGVIVSSHGGFSF